MARSGKPKKTWGDQYLDGAWAWAGDLAKERGYALQVCLVPSRRTEVWRVVVRALHVVDGRPAGVVRQRASEWPDASYTGLGAFIFGLVALLDRDMADDEALVISAQA